MANVGRGGPGSRESASLVWNLLVASSGLALLQLCSPSDPGGLFHIYYLNRKPESNLQSHPLGNHQFTAIKDSWEKTGRRHGVIRNHTDEPQAPPWVKMTKSRGLGPVWDGGDNTHRRVSFQRARKFSPGPAYSKCSINASYHQTWHTTPGQGCPSASSKNKTHLYPNPETHGAIFLSRSLSRATCWPHHGREALPSPR